MAARKRRGTAETGWDKSVREKIKTSMLINRLADHVVGKADMANSQVRAAEILLRKTLPDLSAVEMTGEEGGPVAVQVINYAGSSKSTNPSE